jgi:uncharacterized protein (TIGR02646 family)
MIEIKKGREPDKLLHYRQQDDASYEQMDKEVKEELLEKLLEEQGHICAYCMRRIPEKRVLPNGVPPVTIEHWFPRNPESKEDIGQGLNYRNMFAVCSGNRGCGNKEGMTCDARRGNEPIKVNPCNADTLRGITYNSSGRIQSSDPEIDEDINERLNLNSKSISLPENRKQVLQALIDDVRKNHGTGDISGYCRRKLEQIRDADDPKMPYVGIMIWWLEKHA